MKKNIMIFLLIVVIILEAIIIIYPKKESVVILGYNDQQFIVEPFALVLKNKQQINAPTIKVLDENLIGEKYQIDFCVNDKCYLLQKGDKLSDNNKTSGIFDKIYNGSIEEKFNDIENNTYIKIKVNNKVYKLNLS